MALTDNRSFFGRMGQKIQDAVLGRTDVDEDLIEEFEDILITSDIGMETTARIIEELRSTVKARNLNKEKTVTWTLQNIMTDIVDKKERLALSQQSPLVILVIGVNGCGKTTSIGKIANMEKKKGRKVLLAAADTFRAAAADQLTIWADRAGVDIIKHGEGADPSAVIFDSIQAARSRHADVLICDTAGRLQNKKNLMKELDKMDKVISREWPEAARENLLVLDATTGKNAVSQAREFNEATDITGIILTKLDGTAKGGIALTVSDEFDIPVKFIGTGEGMDDLKPFDPESFIGGIFA